MTKSWLMDIFDLIININWLTVKYINLSRLSRGSQKVIREHLRQKSNKGVENAKKIYVNAHTVITGGYWKIAPTRSVVGKNSSIFCERASKTSVLGFQISEYVSGMLLLKF